uniref:Uncharacterized protein n=1 Tax=Glossina brevipalpis TaxID=37001 RepID=A0A1A9WFL3_9MUSC
MDYNDIVENTFNVNSSDRVYSFGALVKILQTNFKITLKHYRVWFVCFFPFGFHPVKCLILPTGYLCLVSCVISQTNENFNAKFQIHCYAVDTQIKVLQSHLTKNVKIRLAYLRHTISNNALGSIKEMFVLGSGQQYNSKRFSRPRIVISGSLLDNSLNILTKIGTVLNINIPPNDINLY